MREKFAMKNVASETDRALFTVWVKVGFPVGMITQCAAADARSWRRPCHISLKRKRREYQPEALAREGKPEARAKALVTRYPPCFE